MNGVNQINCPNCNHSFDVEDVLSKRLEVQFQQKLAAERKALNDKLNAEQKVLEDSKAAFEVKKRKENELFNERLQKALLDQRAETEKKVNEEFALKLKAQAEELAEKKLKINQMQKQEIEIMRREAKLKEEQESLELKLEKQMLEKQSEIEEKARIKQQAEFDLKEAELIKKMDDQKKLIEEMKRKAEQGSMQLQGEIQELVIEEQLRQQFPFDMIEEVPKGIRGADSVQTVINSTQKECGKIVFESKRTKDFSEKWIEKLKDDQRIVKAEIAVLISAVLPKSINGFGLKDGVWICDFQNFVPLVQVLRQMLIKVQSTKQAEENKGDKMEMMYSFVTSEAFSSRIHAIVEGFSNMKSELDQEKRAMNRIWSRREKQIDKVIENTVSLHGSIEGIAGKSFPDLEILSLNDGQDD